MRPAMATRSSSRRGTYTGTGDEVVDMLGKAITLRGERGA